MDVYGDFWGGRQGGYQMQQNPDEFARLCLLLAAFEPYQCALDIGVSQGGAYRFVRECVDIRQSYVIEDGKHPGASLWKYNKSQFADATVEFQGDSHSEECRKWLKSCDAAFDLVSIDGDHRYDGVRADWELIMPYLRTGALVWFHDIRVLQSDCEVSRLWQEIKSLKNVTIMMETPKPPTGQPLGIGVLRWHGA